MDHQTMLAEQVGQGILQVAAMEEKKLDQQLKAMENLGKLIILPCVCFHVIHECLF
jgi:hypothetical protein